MSAARTRGTRDARGFTVIEIITVFAIMGFIALIALPFLSTSIATNDLQIATQETVDALREAQSSAMSGKGGGHFGVHIESAQFVYFEGSTYVPGAATNVVHALSGNVSITGVTLSGGGDDVRFSNHKGEPTETGSITLTDITGDARTVVVNAVGMIDVQ